MDRVRKWKNDKDQFHREDGPAVIYFQGDTPYSLLWYQHGELHREDGPAVTTECGIKRWYLNGKRHRMDGPAEINSEGEESWYQNNKLHRLDGPALICSDGYVEYWVEGRQVEPFEGIYELEQEETS